ncbi:MAG: FAD-dependent oxidoreductase [Clostridiaceae bacterium]|nr:FAD-dependent oxidoreductase [Eubacteriales bacterium]
MLNFYDVIVLGAGPAGLAAAIGAHDAGAKTLIVEREERMGGILKQCIHDGFGLLNFGERMTGPEYAGRYLKEFYARRIDCVLSAFADSVQKTPEGFSLSLRTAEGMERVSCAALVLACGCRERTSRQVFIHGDRPAGVFTAGAAQYYVNVMGYLPTKRCVILGSGDIGLIMARRLTLEGARVLGVYEVKSEPSGLARNIAQCLDDFSIPLHLSTTVTKVFGQKRVEAVEVCKVDENMQPIAETAQRIECDALILSVGLIPENEVAESLGVEIDPATKGPWVDQSFMTSVDGVFCCGNALHVHDLVDHVSRGALAAGKCAARYERWRERKLLPVACEKGDFLYVAPQRFDANAGREMDVCFRSRETKKGAAVSISADGALIKRKSYARLAPAEMECLAVSVPESAARIEVKMEGEL